MIGSADGDRKLIAICRLSRGRCSANYLGGHRDDFQLSVWRHFPRARMCCNAALSSAAVQIEAREARERRDEFTLNLSLICAIAKSPPIEAVAAAPNGAPISVVQCFWDERNKLDHRRRAR